MVFALLLVSRNSFSALGVISENRHNQIQWIHPCEVSRIQRKQVIYLKNRCSSNVDMLLVIAGDGVFTRSP